MTAPTENGVEAFFNVGLPGFRWGRTAHAAFREIYLVDSEEDRTAGQARSELLQKPGAGN